MKVFLTGGTGFIGQSLSKSLLRRSWNVTALVRNPDSPQAQALIKMGAQLAIGDVTKRESMRADMTDSDIVLNNAGQYEYGMSSAGKKRMHSVNVVGTENVLDLAQELKIPLTIHVSTIQAFGETGSQSRDETFARQVQCRTIYEHSKTEAHEIALQYQQSGLPLIIVCPHQVIGANDHSAFGYFQRLYVNRILPPLAWSPNTIFCCVEVNDLAEGISLAAEKGRIGETYFLCGDPQSFREIINCWSKNPGALIPRFWLPVGLAKVLFTPLEPLLRILGLPAFLSRETVRASATNWNYSCEKAKRELGWTHCSAETMWFSAIDGEIQLLSKRKTQNLLQRLKPLEIVE
jgi:nucleoside-diphosphate-sugar epimerase